MTTPQEQLNTLIDSYQGDILAAAQRLIAFDSEYQPEGGPGQPFGPKIAAALDCVLEMAADMGFITRNVDGYMGVADMGDPGRGKKIGVIGHIDVVPAGDGWTYPPFKGRVVDGRLYGRGSADDKGPLVAALFAMKAVADSGLPLSNHGRLLIGTDEESGFRCIKYYLTQEEQPWGGFSPDAEFPVIYGEKGTYRFQAGAEWPADDANARLSLLDLRGGTRLNVVPEYAVAKLAGDDPLSQLAEQLRPEGITLRREDGLLVAEAHGVSTHAATPWFGKSANNMLLNYLARLPLAPAGAENFIRALAKYFADGHLGQAAGVAQEHGEFGPLTISLGVLEAGPAGGSASFDMRYPELDSHDRLWSQLQELFSGVGLWCKLLQDKPGLYVPRGSFLIQSLRQAYREASGRQEEPVTIGGGTYCRALNNFVAFGPLFPGQRELAHERDEYIAVEDLLLCAKIYAQALYNLLK